ncbi:MAG: chemotaxis protein CheW [Planctomycetales bacterium]|nr:chemotaxis protein CheW [Planctomycetales bacterium]
MSHSTSNQYCIVRCGESWYALPSTAVREVMVSPDVTPLPNTSSILHGIAHVNNEFLTITDPLLPDENGQKRGTDSQEERVRQLLVLASSDGYWGILVDEVAGLTDLGSTMQPNRTTDRHLHFIGNAVHKDNELRIVDTEATYRAVMAEVKANWQQSFRSFEMAQEAQP